jgi:hypothetical protein
MTKWFYSFYTKRQTPIIVAKGQAASSRADPLSAYGFGCAAKYFQINCEAEMVVVG